MEELGNSLNQSMAEIFEAKSPLAKRRDKLNDQINTAKIFIKSINQENIDFDTVVDYLNIFYTGKELEKQITRMKKNSNDNIRTLTSMYSLLTHKMEMLDRIKSEIKDMTE